MTQSWRRSVWADRQISSQIHGVLNYWPVPPVGWRHVFAPPVASRHEFGSSSDDVGPRASSGGGCRQILHESGQSDENACFTARSFSANARRGIDDLTGSTRFAPTSPQTLPSLPTDSPNDSRAPAKPPSRRRVSRTKGSCSQRQPASPMIFRQGVSRSRPRSRSKCRSVDAFCAPSQPPFRFPSKQPAPHSAPQPLPSPPGHRLSVQACRPHSRPSSAPRPRPTPRAKPTRVKPASGRRSAPTTTRARCTT